jgi:16S rRNA processing protein RimM
MTDRICVGTLAGSFGVHGEVRVKSFTAEPTALADYTPLTSEDGKREFTITLTRPISSGFSAKVSGVNSKEAADALKGTKLFANRDQLPDLPDDEFYHADLIGLDVFDTGGVLLGQVKAVLNHGAGDLLELEGTGSTSGVLMPFTQEVVPTVDLKSGRIVADPPEGLF